MREILIVEDSPVQREFIRNRVLQKFPHANIRMAGDPFEAREAIAEKSPDVMLLDVDLPRMSGVEFLGHVMRSHPLPVIIVTGTVPEDDDRWKKLAQLGCRSIISKPRGTKDHTRFDSELYQAISGAIRGESASSNNRSALPPSKPGKSIIGIGSSTGGPKALEVVLAGLDEHCPPVVIAQHISARFAQPLVDTLQQRTKLKVKLVEDGERLQAGHAYVSTPTHNTRVVAGMRIALDPADPACRFTPNVDVLFYSLATIRDCTIAAALLTGMGDDGAKGLLAIRESGALTVAQDQKSCVVYGMPARAAELNAAMHILDLDAIAPILCDWYENSRSARRESCAAT